MRFELPTETDWAPWFAWKPVECDDTLAWLETVERKRYRVHQYGNDFAWAYRVRSEQARSV